MGCGSDINCFSVNTGKLVANYIADENFGRIVNLCFHPSDDKVLVAIHLNGIIVFWNLIGTQAAKLLKHQVILFKFIIGSHNMLYIFSFQELDLKECYLINGKCLAKKYCSYDVDCIVISYKLESFNNDDINIGLFSLENGTVLYIFNET